MSLSRPLAVSVAPPAPARARRWSAVSSLDVALLLGLVLAGLALRLPYLWMIPRFSDETREVLRALDILHGDEPGLVNVDAYIGGFYNWLLAVIFWLTGPSPYTPRLVVAVAGALTVGATYLLARDTSLDEPSPSFASQGERVEPSPPGRGQGEGLGRGQGEGVNPRVAGVVAAGLLATAGGHILSNGHLAWSHCLTPLFTTLAAWLLHRAVRAGSAVAMLGSGLAFGLALQTHPATLVLLPGAALYVVWWGRRWLRTPWPYLALGLFVLGIANVIVYNVLTGGGTIDDASIVRDRYARGRSIVIDAGTYAENQVPYGVMLLRYLSGAVDARGPADARGMPLSTAPFLLDPTLWLYGALSLAGLVLAARHGAPLPLLMVVSSSLVLPYFNERKYVPISDGRYLMPLLPLAFAGVGTLAASAWRAVEGRGVPLRAACAVGAAVLIVWPLVPLARYFGQEVEAGRTNGPLWDVSARVAAERRADEPVVLDRDLSDIKLEGGGTAFRALRFLLKTRGIDDRSVDDLNDYAVRMPPGTTALVVADARKAGTGDALRASSARSTVVAAPAGAAGFGVYRLEAPGGLAASSATVGPRGFSTYALASEAPVSEVLAADAAYAAPSQGAANGRDEAATGAMQIAGKPADGVSVQVFASGFVNPRGIAFRSDGSMFIAEAGSSGESDPRGQLVDVGRDKPHTISKTGQITRVTPGGDRFSMAHGIPSIVTAVGEEVGPSGLAFIDDTLYVLTASGGWDVGDPSFNSGIFRLTPDGKLDKVFDYTEYVRENPSRSRREDPRADVPYGMPYGLTALNGKLYTTDGNQEQVFEVDPASGAARQVAEYPRSNRALTGIAAGPDGALYVAEMASAKITRIATDGQISDAATKLVTPIAVAFDSSGVMYALEYTGRLLRTAPVGQAHRDVLIEGLNKPTAMAFGPDGNLYVSVYGHAAGHGEGLVLRVKLAPDPPGNELRYVPVLLAWGIGLGLFAVFMAVGWRNRARAGTAAR